MLMLVLVLLRVLHRFNNVAGDGDFLGLSHFLHCSALVPPPRLNITIQPFWDFRSPTHLLLLASSLNAVLALSCELPDRIRSK